MLSLRALPVLLLLALFLSSPAHAQTKAEQLDALLTKYHEVGQLNGAVLVAEGDDVLFERGFGEANMEWDIPNTPDTRFRVGSVTKQFTAALILQLAEEGQIDLQAPVTAYVPGYPAATGDRITVHHLLTHTGGIPNYTSFPGFMQDAARDPYAPDSFLAVFSGMDLEFEPGSAWSYSNSGYFLLGVIIEEVAGKAYDAVLRERIVEPLGLADTGYDHFGEIIERRAAGYVQTGLGYEHAPYLDTTIPYAAGMIYSTVRDLLTWNRALHGGEVFQRPETLAQMTTPYKDGYGYGVGIGEATVGDTTISTIRHSGGINGFSAQLWYMPVEEATIAVLDNTSGNSGGVVEAIARVLYDQPAPDPKRPISSVLGKVIEREGIAAAEARYRELKASQPETYDFDEGELNALGYAYLGRGDAETALRIFQLNVEAYPEAFNPYDSLGEAYLAAGDTARAIANYERSVELNPGNANGRRVLESLGVEVDEETVVLPADVLEGYVGRYHLQPNFVLEVTHEGDRLFAQATGQPRFEVFPSAEDEFYLTVVDAQITFNRSDAGAVESLTLHQNGQHMPAPKVE